MFRRTRFLRLKVFNIQVFKGIYPLPLPIQTLIAGPVTAQQTDNLIHINPDFAVAFLLAFVKHKLHTKMKMDRFDIVCIFLVGIKDPRHDVVTDETLFENGKGLNVELIGESGNLLYISMDFDTSDYYLYEKRDVKTIF